MTETKKNISFFHSPQRILELFKFMRPYRMRFLLILLTGGLAMVLGLAPTYLMKPLTDTVFVPAAPMPKADRFHVLNMLVIALLAVYALKAILDAVLSYQRRWVLEKIGLDIRNSIFAKLHALSLKYFSFEQTGTLLSRITYDSTILNYFVTYELIDFFVAIMTLIGMGVILFYLDWKLALMMLLPTPIILVLGKLFEQRLVFAYRLFYQKMGNMSSMIVNSITGVALIKINVAERKEVTKFNRVSHDVFLASMQLTWVSLSFDPLKGAIVFSCATLVYWVGGQGVINERLTMGGLMVFIGYMWQFYAPLEMIGSMYTKFQNFVAGAERVSKIIDAVPDIQNKPDAIVLRDIRGSIKFDDVFFSYDGKKPTLEHINFDVKPGEVIGVTGPSGAGKSTLNLLLCRLYDVTGGAILVDGHNVKDVNDVSLRTQIGLVMQETWLFFGTIAENISYGKAGATGDEIVAAAKAAGAHDFIMRLEDAYDTHVGEGGVGLSGGERQRIAIARVLVKNPKVIIFDEATSAVDSETEAIIHATIDRLAKRHTIIVVSHRLSLLKNTDRLLVLDRGRIVETGPFETLKSDGKLFSRLYQVQEV